jgi:hypothetical protein
MDKNGMKLSPEKVWAKHPGGLLRKPALLVCDQFKSHVTEATKRRVKDLNRQLAVIPGDLTSLQPLDVSINKPFKAFMREVNEMDGRTTSWPVTNMKNEVTNNITSLWMGENVTGIN